MTIEKAGDIQAEWSVRAMAYSADHLLMDKMVGVYEGGLPEEYSDFFHEEQHVHLINSIRLSWDDLSNLAGKVFPIYVEPDDDSATSKDRAERLEKIGYGWNDAGRAAGGISARMLMKVLSWWLVGTANAVAMVLPDFENKSPYLTWRDPRSHFPPVGWTPWNETRATDAIFSYQKTLAQLKAEYPDKRDEIAQSLRKIYNLGGLSRSSQDDDDTWIWVGEYFHDDTWMVATLEDKGVTLLRSDTGDKGHPGVQPVTAFSLFSASGAKGRSLFADQVSIQAAMARMFSQKLDFFDRTLYPIIFTTPLAGETIKIGPFAVNEWDTTSSTTPPRLDTISPANAIDADETMKFALGLSRMLNRNPESMQGAGEADSAKALTKLQEGVTQTIREGIWPTLIEGFPNLYSAAARMELNLWGDVKKYASGVRKNTSFRLEYRPRVHLKDREYTFNVEPGVGLSGYAGTQEILMLVGAELMSEDSALEQGEWSRAPQEEKRRIQGDRMEKLIWATLQTRAVQPPEMPGSLKPGAMGTLRQMVFDEGKDLFDSVKELEETDQLYETAPIAPPGGDPLAALLGGAGGAPGPAGGGTMLPPPSLEALRRG